MGTIFKLVPNIHVDVDRCLRHRGMRSPYNFFIIGRDGPTRYRLYLRPWSYLPKWQWQEQLERDGMVKWAEGTLDPKHMDFFRCTDTDLYTEIPRVLHLAFSPRNPDEELDDFYEAEVRFLCISDKLPSFTIASVIRADKF